MQRHEQMDWLDAQAHEDPRWADLEMEIRRKAVQIVDQVLSESAGGAVDVVLLRPSMNPGNGFEQVRIYRDDIAMIGGLEQLLLVEEILRRGMYAVPKPRLAPNRDWPFQL